MRTEVGTYLLSASSGVPNILALIFFRCFLTATFMASSRSPGTLWSVSSSLQGGGKVTGLPTVSLTPKNLFFETLCLTNSPQALAYVSLLPVTLRTAPPSLG